MKRLFGAIAIACLPFTVSSGLAAELDKVALRLNFLPWAMHAPYYLGREQGIFAKNGIELDIRPASSGQQNEMFVSTEREQFGVANVDSFVKAKSVGLKVVAISLDQPNTPFSFISLAKSNITKPEDLKGRKVAWFQTNAIGILLPVLKAGGLTQKDIQLVTISRGAEIPMLMAGQVDVMSGYYSAQAPAIEARGEKVNILRLSDYGLNMYGTLIYTSDAVRAKNPDLVKRFLHSYLESLIATIADREKAISALAAAVPDINKDLELRKLDYVLDSYKAKDYNVQFGIMNDAKWIETAKVFLESGDIKEIPNPKDLYTNDFITADPLAKVVVEKLRQ